MGPAGQGAVRRRRVLLLQPAGPQVPQRHPPQPRRGLRLLEGHRHRQAHPRRRHRRGRRRQEGARLLQGPPAQGLQDQLDHARVPPRRRLHQPPRRLPPALQVQERLHEAGRQGAVPDLQEVRPRVADGAAARRLRAPGPRRAFSRRLLRRLLRQQQLVRRRAGHRRRCCCWYYDDHYYASRRHAAAAAPAPAAGGAAEAPQDPLHLRAAVGRVRARADLGRPGRRGRRPLPARRAPVPQPAPGRRRRRLRPHDVLAAPGRRGRREAQGDDDDEHEPGRVRRHCPPPPVSGGQEAQRRLLLRRRPAAGQRLAGDDVVRAWRRPQPPHAPTVLDRRLLVADFVAGTSSMHVLHHQLIDVMDRQRNS